MTTNDAATRTSGHAYALPDQNISPNHPSTRHKLGNPLAYFKKCMRLYADGHGRAGMAEFWSFVLIETLLLAGFGVLMVADPAVRSDTGEPGAMFWVGLLGLIAVILGLIVPGITVAIRRLHDFGASGWFYLISLVVGTPFFIVIGLIPSSAQPNEHGPSPKADPSDVFA